MEKAMLFCPREIKESVKCDGEEILRINFAIPCFSVGDGEKDGKIPERINSYYEDVGNAAYNYCKKEYPKLISEGMHGKGKNAAVMKCRKTFECREFFSVMTDFSFYNGGTTVTRRFSETWDKKNGYLLTPCELFDTGRRSVRHITDIICSKIDSGEGGFDYKENAAYGAKKYFDVNNFYFVPNGIAFYYKNDVILKKDGKIPAFVVQFDDIKLTSKPTFE